MSSDGRDLPGGDCIEHRMGCRLQSSSRQR